LTVKQTDAIRKRCNEVFGTHLAQIEDVDAACE
jgi:hypothetical protein